MSLFSKITDSVKGFIKSDVGKVALGVGATFLMPGIGASGVGTSLGMQGVRAAKGIYDVTKAKAAGEGLLGLKSKIQGAQGLMSSLGGGSSGGVSSYGGGSSDYASTAAAGLTTYSPEGSAAVQGPHAADYSAFLNESLQMYAYAEQQGSKVT